MVGFGALQILIVDDEPLVAESLKLVLNAFGHRVDIANDGEEALVKYEANRYDLVVTDLRMPGMTGDQVASAIRERNARQRIIMMTGFPPKEQPEAVDLVLLKPFSLEGLRNALNELLSEAA